MDMVGIVLGRNQYQVTYTIVSLPEPIWTANGIVVISVPMVQNLIRIA